MFHKASLYIWLQPYSFVLNVPAAGKGYFSNKNSDICRENKNNLGLSLSLNDIFISQWEVGAGWTNEKKIILEWMVSVCISGSL